MSISYQKIKLYTSSHACFQERQVAGQTDLLRHQMLKWRTTQIQSERLLGTRPPKKNSQNIKQQLKRLAKPT